MTCKVKKKNRPVKVPGGDVDSMIAEHTGSSPMHIVSLGGYALTCTFLANGSDATLPSYNLADEVD